MNVIDLLLLVAGILSSCWAMKAAWNDEWSRATFFLVIAIVLLR